MTNEYHWGVDYSNSLTHHGILNQRWGVRRFQNPDGSLTPEGKLRYARSQRRDEIRRIKEQRRNETRQFKEEIARDRQRLKEAKFVERQQRRNAKAVAKAQKEHEREIAEAKREIERNAKRERKAIAKQRAALRALEKEQSREQKRQEAARKVAEKIVRSGNYDKIMKNMGLLDDEELKRAFARLQIVNNGKPKGRLNKLMKTALDATKDVSSVTNNTGNIIKNLDTAIENYVKAVPKLNGVFGPNKFKNPKYLTDAEINEILKRKNQNNNQNQNNP